MQRWTTFFRLLLSLHTGVIIIGKLYFTPTGYTIETASTMLGLFVVN